MTISRRHFLQGLSVTGVVTALGGFGARAVASSPPNAALAGAPGSGTLVLVTLYGGNDGLDTVVPVEDPVYRTARGALALDPAATHPLGEGFGLHPALGGLKQLWDTQRLAIVHAVGFDGLDRSHFHCTDVWQAGSTDDQTTGWLGRWLDAVGRDPLDAIAVGRQLPLALRGADRSAAVVPVGSFGLPGDDRARRHLVALSAADRSRPRLAAAVAATTADLLDVVDEMSPIVAAAGPAVDELADDAEAASGRRAGGLGAQLDVVAAAIEADVPARVYAVGLGGFDTHARQAATHAALLTELDQAISAFTTRMAARPVTVLVHSEFGRRVAANGSAGTDHGAAGVVLLAGRVRAGFHGEPSPLDRLVDGDLTTTTDFRSVYGGVLEGVLGMPAGDVLDGAPGPLTLV